MWDATIISSVRFGRVIVTFPAQKLMARIANSHEVFHFLVPAMGGIHMMDGIHGPHAAAFALVARALPDCFTLERLFATA